MTSKKIKMKLLFIFLNDFMILKKILGESSVNNLQMQNLYKKIVNFLFFGRACNSLIIKVKISSFCHIIFNLFIFIMQERDGYLLSLVHFAGVYQPVSVTLKPSSRLKINFAIHSCKLTLIMNRHIQQKPRRM